MEKSLDAKFRYLKIVNALPQNVHIRFIHDP